MRAAGSKDMGAFRFRQQETRQAVDILPPEAAARTAFRRQRAKVEVIDAEFETIAPGNRRPHRSTVNDNHYSNVRHQASTVPGGFARLLVASALVGERLLQRASPRTFAGLVAGTFASVFLFAVAFAGFQTPAGAPGLRVAGVSTSLDDRNGMQVLSVYGRVENGDAAARRTPLLLVEVISDGITSTSSLRPEASTIAGGQSSYFSARLPHKGGKMPEVRVSLAPAGAPAN